jgi:predicted O-linked N-acetylglucosamine transferase (SPINDLY family)
MRLAPVQIAAWGHPETTGLPTIEYYLSAEAFETGNSQNHYTERLVTLPNLGCYYAPEEQAVESEACPGRSGNMAAPLFVCPGTPFKYAPQHDDVFVKIAHRLKNVRFVFFTYAPVPLLSNRLEERIQRAFAAEGLDYSKHVEFIPWQPKAGFFSVLRRADVFLDTIGFSGFNTAMQAIECGLPIVTREGRFMRGRFASAILKQMQLGELVAVDKQAYVECAVRLAQDREYNARIREKIVQSRRILFRDSRPIRALEDFLTDLTVSKAF